jgi:4-hydroxybenzoate polyprenyltransferase
MLGNNKEAVMKKIAKVFGIFIGTVLILGIVAGLLAREGESVELKWLTLMCFWLIFRDIYKHYYESNG